MALTALNRKCTENGELTEALWCISKPHQCQVVPKDITELQYDPGHLPNYKRVKSENTLQK